METDLIACCRESLIQWRCPRESEFREELPLTLVGKVAFNVLAEENLARMKEKGEYTG